MTTNNQLRKAFRRALKRSQFAEQEIGFTGYLDDAADTVSVLVAGMPNHVYVRLGALTGDDPGRDTVPVRNGGAVRITNRMVNVPVTLGWTKEGERIITGVSAVLADELFGDTLGAVFQPNVPVELWTNPIPGEMLNPGRVRLSSTGGMTVAVEPFEYYYGGTRKAYLGGTLDLTASIPGTANKKAAVVICVNDSNTLTQTAATAVDDYPPEFTRTDYDAVATTGLRLMGITLRNGQTSITETDPRNGGFMDLRPWLSFSDVSAGDVILKTPTGGTSNTITAPTGYTGLIVNSLGVGANPNTQFFRLQVGGDAGTVFQVTENKLGYWNPQGLSDADLRLAGDSNTDLFYLDASADAIGIGTASPNANMIWDVSSTTRAARPAPSMTTTQRNALTGVEGAEIWNTTTKQKEYYNGTAWVYPTTSGTGSINTAGTTFDPHAQPISPEVTYSDEFDDNSLDGKWTEYDPDGAQTVAEDARGLVLSHASDNTVRKVRGIYQALPANDFTIWTYVTIGNTINPLTNAGIALFDNATDSTKPIIVLSTSPENSRYVVTLKHTAYNSTVTLSAGSITFPLGVAFLRVRYVHSTTTWAFDYSSAGMIYRQFDTVTNAGLGYTPSHFGLVSYDLNNLASTTMYAQFGFFRYTASNVGESGISEGQRAYHVIP